MFGVLLLSVSTTFRSSTSSFVHPTDLQRSLMLALAGLRKAEQPDPQVSFHTARRGGTQTTHRLTVPRMQQKKVFGFQHILLMIGKVQQTQQWSLTGL